MGWKDQGMAFDVAVHLGSLIAVLAYFAKDILAILADWFRSLVGGPSTANSRMGWWVILGTIPVGVAGLIFKDDIDKYGRDPLVIAGATIIFGILLWLADSIGKRVRTEDNLTAKDVATVGIFQAFALIPGTSRSGATMTAGLFLGFTRKAAARFSFLLSIPVILLASLLKGYDLYKAETATNWGDLGLAAAVAAITAFITIALFLKALERISMLPFILYRFALGIAIIFLATNVV
jgi:undecaprenyl-diphosphatase